MRASLQLHPECRSPAHAVEVEARREGTGLRLRYRLTGEVGRIRLAEPAEPERADGLWRHSCFEAFLRPDGESAYYEINLSPSSRWAAYRLDSYRSGLSEAVIPPPRIAVARSSAAFELEASVDLSGVRPLAERGWRLGLAAIVEAADGGLSYWALAHPPGEPDFHHEAGFVRRL